VHRLSARFAKAIVVKNLRRSPDSIREGSHLSIHLSIRDSDKKGDIEGKRQLVLRHNQPTI